MCCCKVIPGPGMTQKQADFIGCLLTATLTATPVFLDALMNCLAGGGASPDPTDFRPGERIRCD